MTGCEGGNGTDLAGGSSLDTGLPIKLAPTWNVNGRGAWCGGVESVSVLLVVALVALQAEEVNFLLSR